MINGKLIFVRTKQFKLVNLVMWDKNKFLFETLITLVLMYGCEFLGCILSRETWRRIEQIQKHFITYNLKIKINMMYHILLTEVCLSPIKSMAMVMTRYMGNERLPKIALNSSQNQLRLKRCWGKDTIPWLG